MLPRPNRHLLRQFSTTTPPDPTALSNLILTSTDPETLTQTLTSPALHWTPTLVNAILKRLWNHAPKALHFFHLLHTHHPSYTHHPSSFDHAIDLSSRLRDPSSTDSLFHLMHSLGISPTRKTFAIVAERYAFSGKPHKAIKVFLSMHEHGCLLELSSFNNLLDVLCKSRRVEMACGLFRALRSRFRPDCVTYNVLANGWCLVKKVPKALEVLREMVDGGLVPNLTSYNIILKGYLRVGLVNEAWGFFLEMKGRGCEVDVVTYTTLVHGFGVLGEVRRARNVFDRMVEDGVLPSVATYNALIQVLCKKDSVENAVSVFEEMVRKGYEPNAITYNLVIRGFSHRGQMERAIGFMERMRGDGCEPNVQTYNVVIRYFCLVGEVDRGLDLFENMRNDGCLPNLDTYNILISAMFLRKKSEDLVVAGKLLIEMVDRGFIPRRFTFNRVLNGLLVTGNQGFAREILRLQSKCGGLPRRFRL